MQRLGTTMGRLDGALDDLVERDRLGFCVGSFFFSSHVDQVAHESRQFLQLSIHIGKELLRGQRLEGPWSG